MHFPRPSIHEDEPIEPQPGEQPDYQPDPRRRRRPRHQPAPPDTLPRYALTALGMLLAVVVVGLLLLQLGQVGKERDSAPATPVPTLVQNTAPQPSREASPPAPAAPAIGPVRKTDRVLEPTYTVERGDTLGSIADRFGTTVDALQSINNLADRNVLSVGQRLVIPNQN